MIGKRGKGSIPVGKEPPAASDDAGPCPPMDELPRALTQDAEPALVEHVEACLACQGVLALYGDRDRAGGDDDSACAAAELVIARSAVSELTDSERTALDEHLVDCAPCRALAEADGGPTSQE